MIAVGFKNSGVLYIRESEFKDYTDMFGSLEVCNNMFWKKCIQFSTEKGFIADISVYI